MSLHLGNLSTRVSRNGLERVFRRFGPCNIQVKDKFGFVVYDFTADAEKALRTLRGKNICGEAITLSWSNKQPRPLESNRRIGRTHDSQSQRRRAGEGYGDKKLGSGDGRNYRITDKQTDVGDRRHKSVDLGNEASFRKDNVEVYNSQKEHVAEDSLHFESATAKSIPMDHESEKVGQPLNDNGLDFERYDPNHADNKRDDKGDLRQSTLSGASPTMTKSKEQKGTEQASDTALKHPDNAKSLPTCYNCGKLGHKKLNCPIGEVTNRKVFSRIDRSHDDKFYYRGKGEDELRRQKFISEKGLQRSRSSVPVRKHRNDWKESSYSRHRMVRRDKSSPLVMEIHRSPREEHQEAGKDFRDGKRRRMDRQSPTRDQAKKLKVAESSPIHSDYTASRSRSHSKSASKFSSQSRLPLSKSASLSSNTTSHSRSNCSKFGNPKVTLKSRTGSPASLSSPVSLGQTLSSSKELQMSQKLSLVNSEIHESEVDERGQLEGHAGLCDHNLYTAYDSGENRSALQSVQVDDDEDMDKTILDDRDGYHAIIRDAQNGDNVSAMVLDEGPLVAGTLSTQDACVALDHPSLPTNKLHSEISTGSHPSSSITAEEMNVVLKFYGLEQPEEHVPVEAYFGSARLWPWEIIYYRRLKKGPISVENYARRLSQNNEFGIVDKYVRSSSGWNDLGKDNS
ncbi:uncharacterized protein LOC141693281 [Apium graveolens]|uniref:uncharacterized protein LOC141693281 n=1 Tax=Apium graveolens TaxID=4045 RepID=UPI003D7BB825